MEQDRKPLVLVLGATGYVGGRLVPELIRSGFAVRCMTRTPEGLSGTAWARDVEVVDGDLSDPSSGMPRRGAIDRFVRRWMATSDRCSPMRGSVECS